MSCLVGVRRGKSDPAVAAGSARLGMVNLTVIVVIGFRCLQALGRLACMEKLPNSEILKMLTGDEPITRAAVESLVAEVMESRCSNDRKVLRARINEAFLAVRQVDLKLGLSSEDAIVIGERITADVVSVTINALAVSADDLRRSLRAIFESEAGLDSTFAAFMTLKPIVPLCVVCGKVIERPADSDRMAGGFKHKDC